jgi:hypothetical protein
VEQSIIIGSTCTARLTDRPVISGVTGETGRLLPEDPMFRLRKTEVNNTQMFVTFENIILSGHALAETTARSAAIYAGLGGISLTLRNVEIRNMSSNAGAISLVKVWVNNVPSPPTAYNLTVISSTFLHNSAVGLLSQELNAACFNVYGGIVANIGVPHISIIKSTFRENIARRYTVLAIGFGEAKININGSVFEKNTAVDLNKTGQSITYNAATIFSQVADLSIVDTVFKNNEADPVQFNAFSLEPSLLVARSLFQGNKGRQVGGVSFSAGLGPACLSSVSFENNEALIPTQIGGSAGALYFAGSQSAGCNVTFKNNNGRGGDVRQA